MLDSFTRTNVRTRTITIVPLWRFALDGDAPFRLNRQISIRKLTRKEKADAELHVGIMGGTSWFCIRCVSKGSTSIPWSDGIRQAEKVIEAMRLFSTGDVGSFIFLEQLTPGMIRFGTPKLMTDRKGKIYRLHGSLREDFIKFWTEYLAWKPTAAITRHIDRFMRAYTNPNWQDRLVDFVTSMEGLVLPNERQELRKQFALRIAWLLGTTRNEREEIFNKAQSIYDERSTVVHGETDDASAENRRICDSAEEMNRKLLVHVMRKPEQFIAKNLNKLLLGT